MRPLRYSINVTLDGCVDHTVGVVDEESHRYWAESLARADGLLLGRVTYQMMEEAWRRPADGVWPAWMAEWMVPFAETIDRMPKHVVSSSLGSVDWNADLIAGDTSGDLENSVRALKETPGAGLFVGGVTLPRALAGLGLIDEYEFVVMPVLAGRGPRLLDGLAGIVDLRLVDRREFASGAVALRYVPQPPPRRGSR